MIDFSKIFDIVFTSVAVAVILFLLISTIAVAARGKRKCGGFDVVLRIVSALVLIVAAVMFAAAILTMLEGSFRILLQSETPEKTAAYLIVSGKQIELPLVDLFILLSSVVGSNLVAMLLICALAALIVDCVVANKKEVKKRPYKNEKTLEQRKREAELRRIRNLGESAVRKADAAASQDTAATTEKQDDEEPTDWREGPKAQEEHVEFVGIKDDASDDFDSFDDVEQETERTESEADGAPAEEQAAEEQLVTEDEFTEQEVISEDEAVQDDALADEALVDEIVEDEFTEEEAEAEAEGLADEQAFDEEPIYEEEPVEDEQIVEDEVIEDESTDEQKLDDDMSGWAYESDENVADEQLETEEITEAEQAEQEVAAEQTERVEKAEDPTVEDIEPDRNIYIPEMRTIEPAPKAAPKKSGTAAKKSSAVSKPKTAAKPKKPAAKKQKAAQPEKKLPVTRKYVILDRRNAVNMFGEYLKERNKAQKEKLESSIDTIIIE